MGEDMVAAAVVEVVAVDVVVVITVIKMATLPENAPNKDRSVIRVKPLPPLTCGSFMINASSLSYSTANHFLSTLLCIPCPLYQCIFCENLGHHMVTFMKAGFSTFIFHTTIQRVVNLFDGIFQRDVK